MLEPPLSPVSYFHIDAAKMDANLLDAIKGSSWTHKLRDQMRHALRVLGAAAAPSVLRLIAKLPPKQQQQAWRVTIPLAIRMHAFDASSAAGMDAGMCAQWEISQDSNSGGWLSDEPPWRRRFRRARRPRVRQPSDRWPQDTCDWWPPFRCGGRGNTAADLSRQRQLVSDCHLGCAPPWWEIRSRNAVISPSFFVLYVQLSHSPVDVDEPFEVAATQRICPPQLMLTVDGTCWPRSYLEADYRFRAIRSAIRYAGEQSIGLSRKEADELLLLDDDYLAARETLRKELAHLPSPEQREPLILLHLTDSDSDAEAISPLRLSTDLWPSPQALQWLLTVFTTERSQV
jgi:hypothetical protein